MDKNLTTTNLTTNNPIDSSLERIEHELFLFTERPYVAVARTRKLGGTLRRYFRRMFRRRG